MNAAQAWRVAVPGMVIAVEQGDGAPEFLAAGTDAAGTQLGADTLFPVASITKLATALAVLRLVAADELALDAPLARYLSEAAPAREGVTLRALLSHVAGLPDDVASELAPYTTELNWPTLAHACLATPPIAAPRRGYATAISAQVCSPFSSSGGPELPLGRPCASWYLDHWASKAIWASSLPGLPRGSPASLAIIGAMTSNRMIQPSGARSRCRGAD